MACVSGAQVRGWFSFEHRGCGVGEALADVSAHYLSQNVCGLVAWHGLCAICHIQQGKVGLL
jgi:hypothetical protein